MKQALIFRLVSKTALKHVDEALMFKQTSHYFIQISKSSSTFSSVTRYFITREIRSRELHGIVHIEKELPDH